ncbi:sodium:proton antiporter [Acidocella sp.]|uniref:sodium:proton antiporter n=1 Tax=Acidocella sp. TaxID=50710 RepID=UPI00260F1650|nr:sodium:proton antiporter [Acidocella sp.]
MNLWLPCLPFAGVLASFALLPGLAPRLWHRRHGLIILAWVALNLAMQAAWQGAGPALGQFWSASLVDFLPFITLLLALYALGGGIGVKGGPWGRPGGNALLLLIATLLASIMGTIGASLLLIHPLLAANGARRESRHLVLAFIILAGNAGGALSPLGDPPLLVGFLRGVPFLWPLAHLAAPLALLTVVVLGLTYGYDRHLAKSEPRPRPRPLRIRGGLNIALLAGLCAALPLEGLWPGPAVPLLSARMPLNTLVFTLAEGAVIVISARFTPSAIRAQNRFAWGAMREIVMLFFAVFVTLPPVFALLSALKPAPDPLAWYWASGIASASLDAAPTYLIFFQAAGGDAAQLTQPPARLLTALAAGAVFFGPLTYLGNAPNLMIREIAARRGVRMPGFIVYALVMCALLMPVLAVIGLWLV